MATTIDRQFASALRLVRGIKTTTPSKKDHKPFSMTAILRFRYNLGGKSPIVAHHDNGTVVFPDKYQSPYCIKDTGWQLVVCRILPEVRHCFACLVTNQGSIKATIYDLSQQLRRVKESLMALVDEDIMAIAMINFSSEGHDLVGYCSLGDNGVNGTKVIAIDDGLIQQGWQMVALSKNPDDTNTLLARSVMDCDMIEYAIDDLTDQLDYVRHPKQDDQQVAQG